MAEDLVYDEELFEDTQKDKYLTFVIDDDGYGIEIQYVTEIIGMQGITEVPELPDFIVGIINLRGQIIPVMDVRTRFQKSFMEYNDRTCIIVINIEEISIGLIVDMVSEVLNIDSGNIVDPPNPKTGFSNKYVKSIGKVNDEIKLILDCVKLLEDEEVEQLTQVS